MKSTFKLKENEQTNKSYSLKIVVSSDSLRRMTRYFIFVTLICCFMEF